jgi:hypothetical protein
MLTKSKDGVGFSRTPIIREVTVAGLESPDVNGELYKSVAEFSADHGIRLQEVVLVCPIEAIIQTDGVVFSGNIRGDYPDLFGVNLVILPVGSWVSIEIRKKKIRLKNISKVGLREIKPNPAPEDSVPERYKKFIARAQRAA